MLLNMGERPLFFLGRALISNHYPVWWNHDVKGDVAYNQLNDGVFQSSGDPAFSYFSRHEATHEAGDKHRSIEEVLEFAGSY